MANSNHIFISFLLILVFLYGCGNEEQSNNKIDHNCGPLLQFSSTREFCRIMDLPISEFTVQYPSNMVADPPARYSVNIDYNYFMVLDDNNIQTESISLGSSTLPRNLKAKKTFYKQILVQAKHVALNHGFKISEEFSGIEIFDGKEYNLYRAVATVNRPELKLLGRYLILGIILEADIDNRNGVFVTFLANENSPIKEFNDFANMSCVSEVWKSIRFDNENIKKVPTEKTEGT